MTTLPTQQVPGLHHRRVGGVVVTAVSDGFLDGSMAVLRNIEADEAARMLVEAFRPVPRRTSVNCFLLRAEGRTALVDCGCGPAMQASAGKLFENLEQAGVAPGSIDTVLLTHMHPDHSNGLARWRGPAALPRCDDPDARGGARVLDRRQAGRDRRANGSRGALLRRCAGATGAVSRPGADVPRRRGVPRRHRCSVAGPYAGP